MQNDDEVKMPLLPKTESEADHVLPGGSTDSASRVHNHTHSHGNHIHSHGHSHGDHGHSHHSLFENDHVDVGDGFLRAFVFGFSDGLVTNMCLILGVYFGAGNTQHRTVILTGIAGLLAGGFSMAIGEWISMKFQQEAHEAQLLLEHKHLTEYPKDEAAHFLRILKNNGLPEDTCKIILRDLEKTTLSQQVKWHAMLELKIDPDELGGSPWKAAGASFTGFSAGAFIPLLPWICTRASAIAFYITIVLSIVFVIVLGSATSVMYNFPKQKLMVVVSRQIILVVIACAVVIGINNGLSRFVPVDSVIGIQTHDST